MADRDNPFCVFNLMALDYALKNLKNDSFKMWVYLNKNQNGFSFFLSKVACNNIGITNYHNAVKDLISKNYLVDDGNNQFSFYEIPQAALRYEN